MALKKSIFLILTIAVACSKDDPQVCTQTVASTVWTSLDQTQLTADVAAIDTYIANHPSSGTIVEDPSGVRYKITTEGTGETPCLESTLKVTYTGALLSNGDVFDSGTNVSFKLNNVIAGWKIALLKFNQGTHATIYIPSGLAYGSGTRTGIPANSNLIFFVELIDFK